MREKEQTFLLQSKTEPPLSALVIFNKSFIVPISPLYIYIMPHKYVRVYSKSTFFSHCLRLPLNPKPTNPRATPNRLTIICKTQLCEYGERVRHANKRSEWSFSCYCCCTSCCFCCFGLYNYKRGRESESEPLIILSFIDS